jgi:hypothetical protein
MKKQIYLIIAIMLLVVVGCQKDSIQVPDMDELTSRPFEQTKTAPVLNIQEAQDDFNPEKFTIASLDGTSDCTPLPRLQITPEWSKSNQHQFAKFSVVETPLLWNNQKIGQLRQVDSKIDRGNKKAEEVEIVTNLISVKDSTGKITHKIKVISGESDYLKNNKISKNNYKQKDSNFTGEVVYYIRVVLK